MMGDGHEARVTDKTKKQDRSRDRACSAGTEMIEQVVQSACQVVRRLEKKLNRMPVSESTTARSMAQTNN
jgi:hypothetical protein